MSSLIKELWIFSKGGIPLIEIFHNSKVDPILLGAFLSAMESFSKEMAGTTLKGFSFAESKFVLTSCLNDSVFLVCRSDTNVKDKKIHKVIKIITEFFEGMYSIEEITNMGGDLSIFDRFKDKINLYFKMAEL